MNLPELQSTIDKCDVAYYRTETLSIMTDAEYDSLKRDLREQCPDDPRLTRVGPPYSAVEIGTKVPHKIPMGSLDNVDSGILGVAATYTSWCKKLDIIDLNIMMSLKIDGSSIVLNYDNGRLISATTRGNGIMGEDVTTNAALFHGVPTTLNQPVTCSVRGEAVLHKSDFEHIMVGKSTDELSNERNVGNGIIGREDGTNSDLIRFYAFNIVNGFHTTEQAKYFTMEALGFTTVPHCVATSVVEIERFYHTILGTRTDLDFHIDGLVLVLNHVDHQLKFMTKDLKSQLRPKYAKALKFPVYSAITTVTNVTVTVGHNRVITPTLDVERVRCGGVFVDSVIVTNYDEIARQNVAIGDEVEIFLAGDVIPNLSRVVKNGINRIPILEPSICPSCGSLTTRENRRGTDGANLYCENLDCGAAKIRKILHWIGSSKKGIDIQGLGDSIIQALYKNGLVLDPADLYTLTPEVLSEVVTVSGVRVGLSRATTIVNNIQAKKVLPLHVFLGALGIDLLGERRAKLLIDAANGELDTLNQWLDTRNLLTLDIDGMRSPELALIHGGSATRRAIIDGIDEYRPLISKLLVAGVTPIPAGPAGVGLSQQSHTVGVLAPVKAQSLPLAGLTFCLTGTRECISEILAHGGTIHDSVKKGTDFLVHKPAKDGRITNKAAKAEALGTKVITLDHLKNILAGKSSIR